MKKCWTVSFSVYILFQPVCSPLSSSWGEEKKESHLSFTDACVMLCRLPIFRKRDCGAGSSTAACKTLDVFYGAWSSVLVWFCFIIYMYILYILTHEAFLRIWHKGGRQVDRMCVCPHWLCCSSGRELRVSPGPGSTVRSLTINSLWSQNTLGSGLFVKKSLSPSLSHTRTPVVWCFCLLSVIFCTANACFMYLQTSRQLLSWPPGSDIFGTRLCLRANGGVFAAGHSVWISQVTSTISISACWQNKMRHSSNGGWLGWKQSGSNTRLHCVTVFGENLQRCGRRLEL